MKELEKYVDEIIDLATNAKCRPLTVKSRVDHPSHYNKGIETIDYIESWNMDFNIGNVIKYVTRAGYKDNKLEDLQKAKWYLERVIEKAKGNI